MNEPNVTTLEVALRDDEHLRTPHDLAIVGSGVSCTYTLIHYLQRLKRSGAVKRSRLIIVEKTGEFWTGVPYGRRSGGSSLIITSLKEFLPEPERAAFVLWLNQNRAAAFESLAADGRELSREWLRAHEQEMSEGNWDALFLPRYVFGRYLQQEASTLLEQATNEGLVDCTLLKAEVVDLRREVQGFTLSVVCGQDQRTSVLAAKVILAPGSPPNKPLGGDEAAGARSDVLQIENIYEPGLDLNLSSIYDFLHTGRAEGRNQVLIIGSNASALEVLYNLVNRTDLAPLIGKLIVASPEGKFPCRITGNPPPADYRAEHLDTLKTSDSVMAIQILEALVQDVASAERQGINVADVFHVISESMVQALNTLSPSEQEKFVTEYGVKIGRWQRRAGPEYRDLVDLLASRRRLEVVKGEFVRYVPVGADGPGCEFIDRVTRKKRVIAAPIGVIIHCAGFADVSESSSPLIQNLIRRGLCVPNASKRGFVVNEHFETSPDCYLMGPLVAGNLNRSLRVWHAESCSRIISMSRMLADALVR